MTNLLDEKEWTKKLLRFQCRGCHQCCVQEGFVYVTQAETERMARYLEMSPFEFVNQYCELWERQRLVLKKDLREVCCFLSEKGCVVHPVKPLQCSGFPRTWRTERSFDYCLGLRNILDLKL